MHAGPGGMADHLLSRANDALQSAHFLGSGSSSPDGDGRGEDGLVMAMKTCTIIVFSTGWISSAAEETTSSAVLVFGDGVDDFGCPGLEKTTYFQKGVTQVDESRSLEP